MTSFSDLMAGITTSAEGVSQAAIPESWMQGRTTYGGLTAALCLEAARGLVGDMPLRTAQIAFVGPSGGAVSLRPTLLRQGKNTAFVSVDMTHEDGYASQCIFGFGQPRESQLRFSFLDMPNVDAPETATSFFREGPRPGFTQNFEMKGVLGDAPVTGSDKRAIGLWMRHKDPALKLDATAILAIADAPPPAALSMFRSPAPISSMTWMAEFLTEDITTEDGWFFALHTADTAQNGYNSQAMTLWNRSGTPILTGRQTVAVFW